MPQKCCFRQKNWHFFGKKSGFLVMVAPEPLIICSQTMQNALLRVQHPQNRVWDPTTDHSGRKNAVFGYKMAFFCNFSGKNAVCFGDGGSETLNNVLSNLAQHFVCDSSTLKIGWGALQMPTQAPKTLFWANKMAFFVNFGAKNAVFW